MSPTVADSLKRYGPMERVGWNVGGNIYRQANGYYAVCDWRDTWVAFNLCRRDALDMLTTLFRAYDAIHPKRR
jgi:hypothetical protein